MREIALIILRGNPREIDSLPNTEAGLCQQFGVSRTVLREAVKVPSAKGLLETRPRIGVRVLPRTRWNLLDPDVMSWQCETGVNETFVRKLCQLRLILEPASAVAAISEGSIEEVKGIWQCYEEMERTVNISFDRYIEADIEFHHLIFQATHNEYVVQMNQTVLNALRAVQQIYRQGHSATSGAIALRLHAGVAEAIAERNPEAARDSMVQLIRRAEQDLYDVIRTTARPG